MMRILVAYRAIDNIAGGVERISAALMNEMIQRGHNVHFFTLDKKGTHSFYPLDEKITWHQLGMGDYKVKASWKLRLQRILMIRKLLKSFKPDVILAFQDGSFFLMRVASIGMDIPVALAERIGPSHFDHTSKGFSRAVSFFLYRFASRLSVQNASYVPQYPDYLQHKMTVIPNPVVAAPTKAQPAGAPGQTRNLLCVGRIGHQKNQLALIEAFSRLHKDFPNWRLVLAGAEEDVAPRALAVELNIADKVQFLGAVKDVGALYKTSHLFCLPSRWEGFPNALAEALSYGLPAVGYAACDGVNDLIEDKSNGLLAVGNGNVQSLASALRILMNDDALRAQMGALAAISIKKYDPKTIFDRWEEFLKLVRAS